MGFPSALPSILSSLVSLYFAEKQLDLYKYWKGKANAIADVAQETAEEIFAKYKALRERDSGTFSAIDQIPDYERCDEGCDSAVVRRAMYDGYFVATDAVENALEQIDCYQVGVGRDIIRQGMMAGSVVGMNRIIDGCIIEDRREDARNVLKLNSKVDVGDRNSAYGGLAQAYASAGEGYLGLMGAAAQGFNGSVAAFGYSLGGVLANASSANSNVINGYPNPSDRSGPAPQFGYASTSYY